MPKYGYGKTFTKDGKRVRYRYTDGEKATRELVPALECHGTQWSFVDDLEIRDLSEMFQYTNKFAPDDLAKTNSAISRLAAKLGRTKRGIRSRLKHINTPTHRAHIRLKMMPHTSRCTACDWLVLSSLTQSTADGILCKGCVRYINHR